MTAGFPGIQYTGHTNYYFKLKAYERNYDQYRSTAKQGQYINLDFAYLKELSTLDMYLRKTILFMALDIEHALKVRLLSISSLARARCISNGTLYPSRYLFNPGVIIKLSSIE